MKSYQYFPHDSNSHHDRKCVSLIRKYGFEGYGRWWVIIEMLRDEPEHKMQVDDMTYDAIGDEIKMESAEAKIFVQDLINKFKLLVSDGVAIWSDSLISRMNEIRDRRHDKVVSGITSGFARQTKNTATNGHVQDPVAALRADNILKDSILKKFPLLSESDYTSHLQDFISIETEKQSLSRPYHEIRTHFFNKIAKQLIPDGSRQFAAAATVKSFAEKYGKKQG